MKKSVLISIRPKWCELIANGKKTIEVRKTRPKLETPFKVYVYCTRFKHGDPDSMINLKGRTSFFMPKGGAVIGEFVCDKILDWHYIPDPDESADPGSMAYDVLTKDGEKTGLEYDDFEDYGKGAPLYGWHISEVVIYDRPKELKQFQIPTTYPARRMSGPPQSWCYAEEI